MSFRTFDFETRSEANLKQRGVVPYMEHPSTEPLCLSMSLGRYDRPFTWVPDWIRDIVDPANLVCELITDKEVWYHFQNKNYKNVAQNSMFEYQMWNKIMVPRYGWPELPLESLHDTMAQLAYHSLPQSLDKASEVLPVKHTKDMAGHRVMMKLCKPRKPVVADHEMLVKEHGWEWDTTKQGHTRARPNDQSAHPILWHEGKEDLEKLINYCCQDVEAEREIHLILPDLPAQERKIWLMDQQINIRGAYTDDGSVRTINKVIAQRKIERRAEFSVLVKGEVNTPLSHTKLKEWVNRESGLPPLDSVAKDVIAGLLDSGAILPPHVAEVLQIRSELAKTSVTKIEAMELRRGADGRINDMHAYHGAGTGRWAGRGVQIHNLPRDSYDENSFDQVLEAFGLGIEAVKLLWAEPFYAASRCVRGAFTAAPGKELICADFSSVEARALAHLAGEEWLLEAYRSGKDLYKVAAADILGKSYDEITKDERQIGKCAVLALGFGGGIGAFASMGVTYGVDIEALPAFVFPSMTEDEFRNAWRLARMFLKNRPGSMSLDAALACDVIKQRWRVARPNITAFWKGIEKAAVKAIQNRGEIFEFRGIRFGIDGLFLKCLLPSGRSIQYYQPDMEEVDTDWGLKNTISYWAMAIPPGKTGAHWSHVFSYGGKLVENIVQGFCRDLLAEAMLRHEAAGYPVVWHVHDEDVCEVDEGTGDLAEFVRIMEIVPPWAMGMPISAEGWIGKRYRK